TTTTKKEADEQFRLVKVSESVSPAVHDLYAFCYLLPLGRFEEAIEQLAKAIAQDPLNVIWRTRPLIVFIEAEMYERAIVEAQKVLEFDDRHYLAHFAIA